MQNSFCYNELRRGPVWILGSGGPSWQSTQKQDTRTPHKWGYNILRDVFIAFKWLMMACTFFWSWESKVGARV